MSNSVRFNLGLKSAFVASLIAATLVFCLSLTEATQAASYLTDDFSDGTQDTSKWKLGLLSRSSSEYNSGVQVGEQGGYLSITPRAGYSGRAFNGYVTTAGANFTDGHVAVQVVQVASSSAQTILGVGIDSNNWYRMGVMGSKVYTQHSTNGKVAQGTFTYSSSTHRWWRIRHDSKTDKVYFETSADGTSWTSRKSTSRTFSHSNLYAEMHAGTSSSVSSPGKALFDNFQIVTATTTTSPTPAPVTSPSPTPTPTPTASPTPAPVTGSSRGYLTTPGELRTIRQKADSQMQPYKAAYDSLMSYAGSPTKWGIMDFTGANVCSYRDAMQDAAALVYAKSLAYHLTGNSDYAADARKHILEMARSVADASGYSGSNGCILTLARHVPGYIVSADLLEDYSGWTSTDKAEFMNWLDNEAYHFVDWASEERSTNWGGDGSAAAGMIADYFAGSGRTLRDRFGKQWSPHDAYIEAKQTQLHRMNGTDDHSTGAPFPKMMNSVCQSFQSTSSTNGYAHGIQSHGGIPEETGRGTTGCAGTKLLDDDSAWTYMHTTLTGMVLQAEMLLRRGDNSLYENIRSDGRGSLEKAMVFTVTPYGAYPSRSSIFELGYRYYRNASIGEAIGVGGSRLIAGGSNSVFLHFGTLTHGFALNENPGLPPTVPAP